MNCAICRRLSRTLLAPTGLLLLLAAAASPSAAAETGWVSGVRTLDDINAFAAWRDSPVGIAIGYIDWKNGWAGMNKYASGSQARLLRRSAPRLSLGHGLFPQGGDLAACAAGEYDDEQSEVARRLQANGVGDAEIRLGWEASGDWFPWSAAGKPPEQWKACFTRVAVAMKARAPGLTIGWYVAKKGRIDVRTIFPDAAPIAMVGISHYDDAQARFGDETFKGGPWGLRAFLHYVQEKNRQRPPGARLGFAVAEWGVGRIGDHPDYVRKMYAFFGEAAASGDLAYEAYFNGNDTRLYPVTGTPVSALTYQGLF